VRRHVARQTFVVRFATVGALVITAFVAADPRDGLALGA
jgi:hypothetical protein